MRLPEAGNPLTRTAGSIRVTARPDSQSVARMMRYVAVGVWNTVFGISLFAALTAAFGTWMPYLVALLIMHVATVVVAYPLYRLFVFRVRVPVIAGFLRFESVYLGSLGLNAALLVVLVEVLNAPVVPAQVVALLTATATTYLAHRHFTFAHRSTSDVAA